MKTKTSFKILLIVAVALSVVAGVFSFRTPSFHNISYEFYQEASDGVVYSVYDNGIFSGYTTFGGWAPAEHSYVSYDFQK